MPTCKYEIVGRKCRYDSDATTGDGFCILHSPNPEKDEKVFGLALRSHRKEKGDIFTGYVFPASFTFKAAEFGGNANFVSTKFSGDAVFESAKFSEDTIFESAKFSGDAVFWNAEFSGDANFTKAKFFTRTLFIRLTEPEAAVDFTDVIIEPPDALIFRDADLSKCRFLGTDLRKAEITNATWPQIGSRVGVYDEIATLAGWETRQWSHIERVYRELKQNYEDRRDYERARDFHYGEKEMRRRNPKNPLGLRFLLTLYWAVSGYGERLLRPIIWAAGLLVISAILYLYLGLHHKDGGPLLAWTGAWDWLEAALYSFRVMTLLKPDDLLPVGLAAKFLNVIQSILGPILIGLFALAIRQRLKR